MKRFIRYLYEYEQGKRLRNVGFVKVEQQDEDCTLNIHGKGLHMKGDRKLDLYLFFEENGECAGIWQGTVDNVNPAINYRLYFSADDVIAPENFQKINGIILESDMGRKYAAVWNDTAVDISRMRVLKPEAAPKEEPQSEWSDSWGESQAGNEKQNGQKIQEESEREEDMRQAEETAPAQEGMRQETTMPKQENDRVDVQPERSVAEQEMVLPGQEAVKEKVVQPVQEEAKREPALSSREEARKESAASVWEEAGRGSAASGWGGGGRESAASGWENVRKGTAMPGREEMRRGSAMPGREVMPESAQAEGSMRQGAETSQRDAFVQEDRMMQNRHAMHGGIPIRQEELRQEGIPGRAMRFPAEDTWQKPGEPDEGMRQESGFSEEKSMQTVNPLRENAAGNESSVQNQNESPQPGNPFMGENGLGGGAAVRQEPIMEEPDQEVFSDADADLEMSEELTVQPIENICGDTEKPEPEERFRCTKIQRNDIARLPRCEWKWANNSFLLHGYYNYHHLAIIHDGEKYRLGVPGIYHPQEAKAASTFGFTEFIPYEDMNMDLTDDEKSSQERFGYWCRPIKRMLKM